MRAMEGTEIAISHQAQHAQRKNLAPHVTLTPDLDQHVQQRVKNELACRSCGADASLENVTLLKERDLIVFSKGEDIRSCESCS